AIGSRQRRSIAHARHLRAAGLVAANLTWNVKQVSRPRRIRHVEDRRAVELLLPGERIDRSWNRVGAAMMADIRNPTVALPMDGGLVSTSTFEVVGADKPHVTGLWWITDGGRRRAAGLPYGS